MAVGASGRTARAVESYRRRAGSPGALTGAEGAGVDVGDCEAADFKGSVGVVLTETGYLAACLRCPLNLCVLVPDGSIAAGVPGRRVDQGSGDGEQSLATTWKTQMVGGGRGEGNPG